MNPATPQKITKSDAENLVDFSIATICAGENVSYINQNSLNFLNQLIISEIKTIAQAAQLATRNSHRTVTTTTDVALVLEAMGYGLDDLSRTLSENKIAAAQGRDIYITPTPQAINNTTVPYSVEFSQEQLNSHLDRVYTAERARRMMYEGQIDHDDDNDDDSNNNNNNNNPRGFSKQVNKNGLVNNLNLNKNSNEDDDSDESDYGDDDDDDDDDTNNDDQNDLYAQLHQSIHLSTPHIPPYLPVPPIIDVSIDSDDDLSAVGGTGNQDDDSVVGIVAVQYNQPRKKQRF
jgi:hypothetical protein